MKKKILKLSFLIAALLLSDGTFAQRNPLKWPFAKTSIWNMPLHNSAIYKPAAIGAATAWGMTEDEDVVILTPSSPLINVNTNAWTDRCPSSSNLLTTLPVPANLVVNAGGTPNFAAGILQPDGRTIYQTQPFQKCATGNTAYSKYVFATSDIYGDGRLGAHGGSGLSSIGGTVRMGELLPGSVIKHALKINLNATKYVFYSAATGGFRWPAAVADAYAASNYSTSCPNYMLMGALLALSPSFNINSLTTGPAKILAKALQDYGGYIVDDTAWDVYAIETEIGPAGSVLKEFLNSYGYNYNVQSLSHPFAMDMATIFTSLQCIDNNNATNIGGGPTTDTINRRAPMAPEFSSIPVAAVTGVTIIPASASIYVSQPINLTSEIIPSYATNQAVTWASDNTTVATVNSSGTVTGVSLGSAVITVTTQDGSKTAICTVTVTASTTTGCSGNLLFNPGFETNLSGWADLGNLYLDTDAANGLGSAYVGTSYGGFKQEVPVTPGLNYSLVVMSKVEESPVAAQFGFVFEDAAGNELPGEVMSGITATTYTQYTLNNVAPANASTAVIWAYKSDIFGGFYLDDFCFTVNSGVLPIKIVEFNAQCADRNTAIELNWTFSGNSIGTEKIVVEKYVGGVFVEIGGLNTSRGQLQYQFKDQNVSREQNMYRLKVIENDKFYYSITRVLKCNAAKKRDVIISPNPANQNITITFSATKAAAQIAIFSGDGKKVASKVLAKGATNCAFDVSKLSSGVYNIFFIEGGNKDVHQFFKN